MMLLLGINSVWGDNYLPGSWNGDFTIDNNVKFVNNELTLTLAANTEYKFKVYDNAYGEKWFGNGGEMRFTNCTNWDFKTSDGNATLKTTCAGVYKFTISWNGSTPSISVKYPAFYLPGSWNEWATNETVQFDQNQMLTLHLTPGNYTFKILGGTSWYGNAGTMDGPKKAWNFNAADNCTITIKSEGDYTFAYSWQNDHPNLSVFSPDENAYSASTSNNDNTAHKGANGRDQRWESATYDYEWWVGQYTTPQTFDNITIDWEGAYGKDFDLLGSNDGKEWTLLAAVRNNDGAGVKSYDLPTVNTYRYVKFKGTKRGTIWAYSFYNFELKYKNVPVPTNVAVGQTGRITYQYNDEADYLEARIYWGEQIVLSQKVNYNDVLNFVPLNTGTYQVKMVAKVGENLSKESTAFDWQVEAGHVYGLSSYINTLMDKASNWPSTKGDQHSLACFTWETKKSGDVIITISEGDGGIGDQGPTHFRGNGMGNGGSFKINGEDITTYFTAVPAKEGTTYVLHLNDPENRPMNGLHITYNATVEYRTSTSNNCYPTLAFDYVYGTTTHLPDHVLPTIAVLEEVSTTSHTTTLHVEASDVDDEGTPTVITYTISDTEQGFAPSIVIPDQDGNFTLEGLKHNTNYHFTLTVEDPTENQTSKDIDITTPFYYNTAYNQWLFNTTDHEGWPVKMTWVTGTNGDIFISLTPNGDEGEGVTEFRGIGLSLEAFTVNGKPASDYFTRETNKNVVTLKLKQDAVVPAGAIIAYNTTADNQSCQYKTGTHQNAWPWLHINDYVYGTYVIDSRTVTEGNYGTICLPYTVEANDYEGATFYTLAEIAGSGDNVTSITIEQVDANAPLEAGTPYIFKATSDLLTWNGRSGLVCTSIDANGLVGNLGARTAIEAGTSNYILSGQKFYYVDAACVDAKAVYVGTNRAYIHAESVVSAPVRGPRLVIGDQHMPTSVDQNRDADASAKVLIDGRIYIIRDTKTYDLTGRMVK